MGGLISSKPSQPSVDDDFLSALHTNQRSLNNVQFKEIVKNHGYSNRVVHMSSFTLSDEVNNNEEELWYQSKISRLTCKCILDALSEIFDGGARKCTLTTTKSILKRAFILKNVKLTQLSKDIDSFGMIRNGTYKLHGIIRINDIPYNKYEWTNNDQNEFCGLLFFSVFHCSHTITIITT